MRRIKSTCAEKMLHALDKVFIHRVKATCAEIVLHAQDKVYMRINSAT